MNKAYNQVRKFHEACGIEMPDKPTLLSGAGEEVNEKWSKNLEYISKVMKEATETGSEVKKRSSYILEELAEFLNAETIEDQADALTDLMYFIIGTFTLIGVKPEPIFDIVAGANLKKVGPDGKVIRDEQGKIRKPEGWLPPEPWIKAEIEQQTRIADCKTCNGESLRGTWMSCPDCC